MASASESVSSEIQHSTITDDSGETKRRVRSGMSVALATFLLIAGFVRASVVSGLYLFAFLMLASVFPMFTWNPFVRFRVVAATMMSVVVFSGLVTVGHIVWAVITAAHNVSPSVVKAMTTIGFVNGTIGSTLATTQAVVPDVVIFLVSSFCLIVHGKQEPQQTRRASLSEHPQQPAAGLSMALIVCAWFAGVFHPSILAFPYIVVSSVTTINWANGATLSSTLCHIPWKFILFVLVAQVVLVYVAQFPGVDFPTSVASVLGLIRIREWTWSYVLSVVGTLLLAILQPLRQTRPQALERQAPLLAAVDTLNTQSSLMVVIAIKVTHTVGPRLVPLVLLTWSVFIPNLLSLPLLFVGLVGIVFEPSTHLNFAVSCTTAYAFALTVAQYLFFIVRSGQQEESTIQNGDDTLARIGFAFWDDSCHTYSRDCIATYLLQWVMLFAISLTRAGLNRALPKPTPSMRFSDVSNQSALPTDSRNSLLSIKRFANNPKAAKLEAMLRQYATKSVDFVVFYLYMGTLLLLYIVGLTAFDIIHGGYMVFCVVLFCAKAHAVWIPRVWSLLVLYVNLVVVLLMLWGFSLLRLPPSHLIGLDGAHVGLYLNVHILPHVAILLAVVAQYHIFKSPRYRNAHSRQQNPDDIEVDRTSRSSSAAYDVPDRDCGPASQISKMLRLSKGSNSAPPRRMSPRTSTTVPLDEMAGAVQVSPMMTDSGEHHSGTTSHSDGPWNLLTFTTLIWVCYGACYTLVGLQSFGFLEPQSPPSLLNLGYLVIGCICAVTHAWSSVAGAGLATTRTIWALLVVYAGFSLVFRYLMQFPDLAQIIIKIWNSNAYTTSDVGVTIFARPQLHLLGDTAILVVCNTLLARFDSLQDQTSTLDLTALKRAVWQLLWVHGSKPLMVALFFAATMHVSLMGLVYLIILFVYLAFRGPGNTRCWFPTSIYAAACIIAKFLFQLRLFDSVRCGCISALYPLQCETISNQPQACMPCLEFCLPWWLGFIDVTSQSSSPNSSLLQYVIPDIAVFVGCIFHRTATLYGEPPLANKRQKTNVDAVCGWFDTIVTRGFESVGSELSMIALVISAAFNADVIGALYLCVFLLFLVLKRRNQNIGWGFALFFLGVLFFIRYLLVLNLPSKSNHLHLGQLSGAVRTWLGLNVRNSNGRDPARTFIPDFILLFFASCQMISAAADVARHGAGEAMARLGTTGARDNDDGVPLASMFQTGYHVPVRLASPVGALIIFAVVEVADSNKSPTVVGLVFAVCSLVLVHVDGVTSIQFRRILWDLFIGIVTLLLIVNAIMQAPFALGIRPVMSRIGLALPSNFEVPMEDPMVIDYALLEELQSFPVPTVAVLVVALTVSTVLHSKKARVIDDETREDMTQSFSRGVHWLKHHKDHTVFMMNELRLERTRRKEYLAAVKAKRVSARERVEAVERDETAVTRSSSRPVGVGGLRARRACEALVDESGLETPIHVDFDDDPTPLEVPSPVDAPGEDMSRSATEVDAKENDGAPVFMAHPIFSICTAWCHTRINRYAFPVQTWSWLGPAAASFVPTKHIGNKSKLPDVGIVGVCHAVLLVCMSNTLAPVTTMVLFNHWLDPCILSLALPLSLLAFALVVRPMPPHWYWRLAIFYTETAIIAKQIALMMSNYYDVPDDIQQRRYDVLKYVGYRVSGDFVVLLALLLHRAMLQRRGLWRHISLAELYPCEAHDDRADEKGASQSGAPNEAPSPKMVSTDFKPAPGDHGNHFSEWFADFTSLVRGRWPGTSDGRDFSVFIVLAQMLALLMLLVGILSSSNGDIDSLNGNTAIASVTVIFVLLSATQFLVIVLDRILWNASSIIAKTAIQICTLVFWFGLFFWDMNDFGTNKAWVGGFFLFQSAYWVVSAMQIRKGYPVFPDSSEYLAKNFSMVGWVCWKAFRLVPFFAELRFLLDWTCTPTCLDFAKWLKLNEISSTLYEREVDLVYWKKEGRKLGQPQPKMTKATTGALLFILLIVVIWGPLLLATLSTAFAPPISLEVLSAEIQLGLQVQSSGVDTAANFDLMSVQGTAESVSCATVASHPFTRGMKLADLHEGVRAYCDAQPHQPTVQIVTFVPEAQGTWMITPPNRARLTELLLRNDSIATITVTSSLSRNSSLPIVKTAYSPDVSLMTAVKLDQEQATALARASNSTGSASSQIPVRIPFAFPPVVTVSALSAAAGVFDVLEDDLHPQQQCVLHASTEARETRCLQWTYTYLNATVFLLHDAHVPFIQWFQLCSGDVGSSTQCETSHLGVSFVVISDPITIGLLSTLGLTLSTVYATFVLFVSRSLRTISTGLVQRITIEDLPSTLYLRRLVRNINEARDTGDLVLEEELFEDLIEIYRSPETLIALCVPPPELERAPSTAAT